MTAPPSCVICTARPPRRALPDSAACQVCTGELDRMLRDLEQLLPVLRALIEPGPAQASDGIRRGTSGASPAPLRVDVLSLLEDPTRGPQAFTARWGTPQTLRAHLSQLIESEHLAAFTRDLRALHAAVIRVCGEPGPAKVATCRRVIRGRECGGPITAVPDAATAVCGLCGDTWDRPRWKLLGRLEAAEAG